MKHEFDLGFQDCEEGYLQPLQSRLQEIICEAKDGHYGTAELIMVIEMALKQSDFRKQWEVK